MTARALIVAAVAWAVANAVVLIGAVWNRMGEPTGRLVVDECALETRYGATPRLRLVATSYYHPAEGTDAGTTLADLGVQPVDEDRFSNDGRRALVAVEVDGDAARAYRAGLAGETDQAMDHRPVVRDAAADAQTLSDRYAGRRQVAVTHGVARPRPAMPRPQEDAATDAPEEPHEPALSLSLRVTDLHLSLDQRRTLSGLTPPRAGDCTPRFEAVIDYGRRWHPWVAELRVLSAVDDPGAEEPPADDVTPRSPSTGPGR